MKQDSNQPLYFHCTLCGECCSSWNIPMEGEKARQLLEKPWARKRLAETGRELAQINAETYRLPLTDENVCVFLGADRRCMVEIHEGMALKPNECQRFPFADIRMPDGSTRHDTSAACKLVAEKLVLAFQSILPEPKGEDNAREDTPDRFPDTVRTGYFSRIDRNTYEQYQEHLRKIFMNPDYSPETALKLARLQLKQLPSSQACATPHTDLRFHPRYAAWVTLFFLRKPYGSLSWYGLLRNKSYADPRLFGFPIDLKARKNIHWDTSHDPHVNAFLYNLLSRKVLLARGASLSSMLTMAAVTLLLIRWYAVTLAWVRGEDQVALSDVTMAIRLTERYYSGHQPRFLKFFHTDWRFRIIETLLLR